MKKLLIAFAILSTAVLYVSAEEIKTINDGDVRDILVFNVVKKVS